MIRFVGCIDNTLATEVLTIGRIYEVVQVKERDGYYVLSLGFRPVSAAEASYAKPLADRTEAFGRARYGPKLNNLPIIQHLNWHRDSLTTEYERGMQSLPLLLPDREEQLPGK
jgi:hypothetical protein